MARRSLQVLLTAAIFPLLAHCGPSLGNTPGSGGDGGHGDATADSGLGGDATEADACVSNCDTEGQRQCSRMDTKVKECRRTSGDCLSWQIAEDCAGQGKICDEQSVTCVDPPSCDDGIQNQDEVDVDCGGVCAPCPAGSHCSDGADCASGICVSGTCLLCEEGRFRCRGNVLERCASGGMSWQNVDRCDFSAGESCDADAGQCQHPSPIGHGPPQSTGVYYQFAFFTADNAPLRCQWCVWDVDSYGDLIFVNEGTYQGGSGGVDVYQVTLLDSDGDGKLEPNQHPENPDNPGDVEERRLTFVTHYDVAIGSQHMFEIYATSDGFYWLKGGRPGQGIWYYDFATSSVSQVVPPPASLSWSTIYGMQVMGYDEVRDLWFTATGDRYVLQYDPATSEWSLEFLYPDLAGTHGDGMEVVVDPNTNIPYVYVSDMTSDYIAQYHEDEFGRWEQVNLFEYDQPNPRDVEGMGFGALNHFWMAGRDALYEVGGGDLATYTEPFDPTHQ